MNGPRNAGIFVGCILIVAVLASCGGGGGGGGGSPPVVQGPPNPQINQTTSHDLSQVVFAGPIVQITGWNYSARQYHDLDNDGKLELIVASWDLDKLPNDMIVYKDTGAGGYVAATAQFFDGAVPQSIWARKLIKADFNGDGRPDFYIADTGDDFPPWPGAQNTLMLSGANGKLSTTPIPNNPTLFQHCAAAGDIDNNGTVDLFVGSNPFGDQNRSSYFIVNDGMGGYQVMRNGIPASLRTNFVFTCELVDVDGDGYLDLLTGSHEYDSPGVPGTPTRLYWGNGTGAFSDASVTVIPRDVDYSIVLDFDAVDLNGDGLRDIVILRTSELPTFYTGYYIQILIQSPVRNLADQSIARLIGNKATWEGKGQRWIDWLRVLDVTGNGFPDIVVDDAFLDRKFVWTNDGTGVFTRVP